MPTLHTAAPSRLASCPPRLRLIVGGRHPAATPHTPGSLKIYQDPLDARRTVLCGSMAQVCEALDRLAMQSDDITAA